MTITNWFKAFTQLFAFAARRRERLHLEAQAALNIQFAHQQAERAHHLKLLELITDSVAEIVMANTPLLTELVKSQQQSTALVQGWLNSFQSTPIPMAPSVAPDLSDEWEPAANHLPPEFHLAYTLDVAKMNEEANKDFDREGSDF